MSTRSSRRKVVEPSTKVGFQPKPKNVARLHFTDEEYDGAEVTVSLSASVGLYMEMSKGARGTDELNALFHRFGDELLVEWNITDRHGNLRPADGQGMVDVDTDFAQAILSTWLDTKAGVSAPLEEEPSDGDDMPVPLIAMETL